MLAAAAIIGMTGRPLREEKKPRKCGLKDCQRPTTHNGGYCCAEHCKLDRERNRSNGKVSYHADNAAGAHGKDTNDK
jgi:hypothetical protein